VDLRDVFRPGGGKSELTPRRLTTLTQQLPQNSRIKTLLSGDDENQRWDEHSHLLALIADLLQAQLSIQVAKGTGKKKPDKITPVNRPHTTGGPAGEIQADANAAAMALLERMGKGEEEAIIQKGTDAGPRR
jgi:hypothetical protein